MKEVRLHIGNVSELLARSPELLEDRLLKFGNVVKPLELRTKPIQEFYFGYITLELDSNQLKKLKSTMSGVVFMGRKLKIEEARENYTERFAAGTASEKDKKHSTERQKINESRMLRIEESRSNEFLNTISGAMVHSTYCAPNDSSSGYMKSCHTFKELSGNTKSKPPVTSLIGKKSYGALTKPEEVWANQYSYMSGRGEVIKGRHRTSQRQASQLRNQTLRILVNGSLKQIKGYKTKLWGIEKNKHVSDLTYCFEDGVWKSGLNYIVERLENDNGVAENTNDERDKDRNILASILQNEEFEKPIALSDIDDEENDVYDHELYGELNEPVLNQNDTSETFEESTGAITENASQKGINERTETDIELDVTSTNNSDQESRSLHENDVNTRTLSLQEESTFQSKETSNLTLIFAPSQNKEMASLKTLESGTEALRGLFDSNEGFKLGAKGDDIDEKQIPDPSEQKDLLNHILREKEPISSLQPATKFGLFWPHFDSPYLFSQSQLSKVGGPKDEPKLPQEELDVEKRDELSNTESSYEKWFWKNRGNFTRDCRRRQRDVMRAFKKRKANPRI